MTLLIGHGYDIHRLESGLDLILAGVKIPYYMGLVGHSDADVLSHAIIDALIGATSNGDIGKFFPNTSQQYQGISSIELIRLTMERIGKVVINNIDTTVIIEDPKLAPYIGAMRLNLSQALQISSEKINIKAKTNEGIGDIGNHKAAVAYAVVLLEKIC